MTKALFKKWIIPIIAMLACTSCKPKIAAEESAPNSEEPNTVPEVESSMVPEVEKTADGVATPSLENVAEAAPDPHTRHCLKTRECAEDEYCHLRTQSCKKKCMSHDECGEDRICRTDGRCSSKYFETVWEITKNNQTITLPFSGWRNANHGDDLRDFSVSWGDGTDWEHFNTSDIKEKISHTYRIPGRYHVKLRGFYDRWGRSGRIDEDGGDTFPLVEVVSFGNIGFSYGAFRNTRIQKIPEDDVPNANSLTSLSQFFYGAKEFNQPIYWDTENVVDMYAMFEYAESYNQPIIFDTSHVENMQSVFSGAVSFNSPVQIDTSSAKIMDCMFCDAESFNQPVSFDTRHVVSFEGMFDGAKSFNQPVNFDTSNALSFVNMFNGAESFNQPVTFNVPKVEGFCNMFANAVRFDNPLTFTNIDPDGLYMIRGMMYNTNNFHSKIDMPLNRYDEKSFQESIHTLAEIPCEIFDGGGLKYKEVAYPKPHSDKPSIRPIVKKQKIGVYDKDHVCRSEEGCTCGDGYCGYRGKCVNNMCECGGYNEYSERFYSVKSNEFKEFTCEVWSEEMDRDRPNILIDRYLWICEKEEGCRYRGWIYPYRSRRGAGDTVPDPIELFSEYEWNYGVYDRILTPEQEKIAQEEGVVYHKSQASDNRCSITNLEIERAWMNSECRKIKPEYLCEDEYCTCGDKVCQRGYVCSDTYQCLCSNPNGCSCGEYHVTWGMGCYNRIPYCGNKPRPTKPGKKSDEWTCRTNWDVEQELEWTSY